MPKNLIWVNNKVCLYRLIISRKLLLFTLSYKWFDKSFQKWLQENWKPVLINKLAYQIKSEQWFLFSIETIFCKVLKENIQNRSNFLPKCFSCILKPSSYFVIQLASIGFFLLLVAKVIFPISWSIVMIKVMHKIPKGRCRFFL